MKIQKFSFKIFCVLFVISLFTLSFAGSSNTSGELNDDVCFERDVMPIFKKKCSGCHNIKNPKDGVMLDSYESIIASKKGRAIVAYDLKRSKVYKKITEDTDEDRMPPPPKPRLTSEEISIINKWIMSGALNTKCETRGNIEDSTVNVPDLTGCDTMNISYKDIQPMIEKNCYKCHSENEPGKLFNLETYQQLKDIQTEGKLYGAVNHLIGFKKMPAKAPKLEGCDLDKLNAWINQGMKE